MLSFFHLRLERRAVEQSGFNSCPPGKIRQVLEIVKTILWPQVTFAGRVLFLIVIMSTRNVLHLEQLY